MKRCAECRRVLSAEERGMCAACKAFYLRELGKAARAVGLEFGENAEVAYRNGFAVAAALDGLHLGHANGCDETADKGAELECDACSVRDCPHGEPLHYHHDGCPACELP